jgi:hypothetical protein
MGEGRGYLVIGGEGASDIETPAASPFTGKFFKMSFSFGVYIVY